MERKHVALACALLAGVAALAVTSALAAMRTAPRPPDPRAFARHVVVLIAGNRYEQAWQLLHPLHQREAPRAEYVGCELREPIPGHLESVRVLRVFDEPVVLARGTTAQSEAVVVRVAIGGGPGGSIVIEDTVHAVPVHGGWRWILPAQRAAAYSAGRCPDGTPASPLPAL